MEDDKQKRCAKTTLQQYMLYTEELRLNEAFRTNKFSSENPNVLQDTWERLTRSLNSVGGPPKSMAAWKKAFTDWKSAVRKRARLLKVGAFQTGGGPAEKPLTDIENFLLEVLGKITIDGVANIPEFGISSKNEAHEQNENDENSLTTTNTSLGTPSTSMKPSSDVPLSSVAVSSNKLTPSRKTSHVAEQDDMSPTPVVTKSRKNTLLLSLRAHLEDNQLNDNNKYQILSDINDNLKKVVAIQEKQCKINENQYKLNLLQ